MPNIQSIRIRVSWLPLGNVLSGKAPILHRERSKHLMPTLKAAGALKHLVQTRLDALEDAHDEGERVIAHEIEWHVPDEEGRNWDMNGYRGPADCATAVRRLIDRLRREYRLDTQEMGQSPWLE